MRPVLLSLLLFLSTLLSFSQSGDDKIFHKENSIAEAGVGFSFFGKSKITLKNHNNTGTDTTFIDTVGSLTFPVRYQYGVTDWLGVGGLARFYNYFEGDKDSNSKAVGIDFGLRADAHFLRTRRLDFSAALGFGFSHASWHLNDFQNTLLYGSGTHFDFEMIFRFYFSDHFGMHLEYGRTMQNFPNAIVENDTGAREEYSLLFRGASYGIGIQVKL